MSTPRERDNTRETRLRRMAQRQGLQLVKSRRRDPFASDYGRMWIVDPGVPPQVSRGEPAWLPGTFAHGSRWNGYDDLDGVEDFLTDVDRREREQDRRERDR